MTTRKERKKVVEKFDPEFRFLLDLDPALEGWRAWAAEYWATWPGPTPIKDSKVKVALNAFLVTYLHGQGLHTLSPEEFFAKDGGLPAPDPALKLVLMNDAEAKQKHDQVSDFLDWILREKLAQPDADGHRVAPPHLKNPFPRRRAKTQRTLTDQKFDPEFRFLLDLDPALEGWRAWAAEYWAAWRGPTPIKDSRVKFSLNAFLVTYLYEQGLHTLSPEAFFARAGGLPAPDLALGLASLTDGSAKKKHDQVSDFLDWILREKLVVFDADGHRVVPPHLANPFPRKRNKKIGKTSDLSFAHVLLMDPKLEDWRSLAAEWLKDQKTGVDARRYALDRFLTHYIYGQNLERNYGRFLLRDTAKPDLTQVYVNAKRSDTQTIQSGDVNLINHTADFLDWVLANKLGDPETGVWDTSRFHNPVRRLDKKGMANNTESNKPSLSIRYIRELRGMLAEGPHFRDWTWAHKAIGEGAAGGDWFDVDPSIIDPNDPDCVVRQRTPTVSEVRAKQYAPDAKIWEMWSPVRAVAIYLKLELPLRTFQVRMLDSGEADTWRYVHAPEGGAFVLNHNEKLATGSPKKPYQRGVFYRSSDAKETYLYINSNKTADINKAGNAKGYVIPWANDEVLYWLEKLRNWQERYNPIAAPMPWTELERKHFGRTPPHPEDLAQRGSACFLFRDPTDADGDKPITDGPLLALWYKLLATLQQRCAERGETLNDGTPLVFVDPDSQTMTRYPLHALRVSLISYFILDVKLPIAVVSKMIAGHATIIMTLYYTKFGHAYMREVMDEAARKEFEADQANHRRFIQDATHEQLTRRFAYVSEDAVRTALQSRSAAAFVFDDKGICPNGATLCDVGGEAIRDNRAEQIYAPVSGFPQERNCVMCRFFLTGPAYLDGLMAVSNAAAEKFWRTSKRYNGFLSKVTQLEDARRDCERKDAPFLRSRELDELTKHAETVALTLSKHRNEMAAAYHLVARSIEIANASQKEGIRLVANGSLSDLKVSFIETTSEFHQLEVVCENAVIHPNSDADFATLRRAQLIDAMLSFNGMEPVLMHLTPEQQLLAGNAVMRLIQARTGSIANSLPFAECRQKLREIGLLRDDVLNEVAQIAAGTPAKALIDHAKAKRVLRYSTVDTDDHAS